MKFVRFGFEVSENVVQCSDVLIYSESIPREKKYSEKIKTSELRTRSSESSNWNQTSRVFLLRLK